MSAALAERIDSRFFAASVVDSRLHTRGLTACHFGHRLPGRIGGVDDGVFAEWCWDGENLSIRGDRYGMYPLFVCASDDAVWVSPSIVTLIREGAPAEPDHDSLAVFLRLGYFLGDETAFRFITAMPPQAILSWRPGAVELSSHHVSRSANSLSRDAAIDGYIDLFRRAVRRRVGADDEIVLPLSGGRDSRHILLELMAQGRRPTRCVTMKHYPPRTDEDARVAAQLTTAMGLPHQVVEPLPRFDAERAKNLATSFCADEHAWAVALADCVRGEAVAIFDGIGGDVLSAGLFVNPNRQALCDAGRLRELAEFLLPTANEATLALLAERDVLPPLARAPAIGRVAAELARHVDAPNPIGSYVFWNRTRREINLIPYALFVPAGPVFAPFLDHELFDFLASLPVGLVLDRRLHTDAIARAYPPYRDVPFQDPAAPRRDAGPMRQDFRRHLLAYAEECRFPLAAADLDDTINPELILYVLQLLRISTTEAQRH